MIKSYHIFTPLLALALLTGCGQTDEPGQYGEPTPAAFSARIGAGASRAAGTEWAAGDAIGISGVSGAKSYANVKHTTALGDGKFTPAGDAIYYQNADAVTFTAYYPYAASLGSDGLITASTADQSQQPSFDFLWAQAEGSDAAPAVNFNFRHRMSRINLHFINGNDVDLTDLEVDVDGLVLSGTFDANTGVAAVSPVAGPSTLHLTGFGTDASVIVFPQEANTVTITANADAQSQLYVCPLDLGTLAPGASYNVDITVKKTGMTVTGSTITDWTDGGEYDCNVGIVDGYWLDADGTYHVTSEKGMAAWLRAVSYNHSLSCTLEEDITIPSSTDGGDNWVPICKGNKYAGTFDGNGHTISNIKLTDPSLWNTGFIYQLDKNGVVKNLTIRDATIEGKYDIGAFVGYNYGTISNCRLASGSTVTANNNGNAGGIAGFNSGGTITDCHLSDGSVVKGIGDTGAGGITGYHNSGVLSNCTMAAGATVYGERSVGGITAATTGGKIIACYALGTVTGVCKESGDTPDYPDVRPGERRCFIGGISSSLSYAEIISCYADCKFSGTNYIAGGITGATGYRASFSAAYWSASSDDISDGIGRIEQTPTGMPVHVNGSEVTWSTAIEAMNAALPADWQYKYEQQGSSSLPVLVKK